MSKVRTELNLPIYLEPGLHHFENWGCKFSVRIDQPPEGLGPEMSSLVSMQYLIHWSDLFEDCWSIKVYGDVDRLKMILMMKGLID